MKKIIIAISLLLISCQDENIIASYKSGNITEKDILQEGQNYNINNIKDFHSLDKAVKEKIAQEIIIQKIILKKAEKQNIHKSLDFKERVSNFKKELLISEFLRKNADASIDEEMLKNKYNEIANSLKGEIEVNASHILVKDQKLANQLYKDITTKKTSFEDAAIKHSKDPSSKSNKGNLGYFTKGQMVKEFEEVVFNLKKNQISKPFKTDFGWHIVKLEEKRAVKIPEFNQIKPKLQSQLQTDGLTKYLKGLIKDSDIKLVSPEKQDKS